MNMRKHNGENINEVNFMFTFNSGRWLICKEVLRFFLDLEGGYVLLNPVMFLFIIGSMPFN